MKIDDFIKKMRDHAEHSIVRTDQCLDRGTTPDVNSAAIMNAICHTIQEGFADMAEALKESLEEIKKEGTK